MTGESVVTGREEFLNHYRCPLCGWNSDIRSSFTALQMIRSFRLDLVFRQCSSPKVKCPGLMVLVGQIITNKPTDG